MTELAPAVEEVMNEYEKAMEDAPVDSENTAK